MFGRKKKPPSDDGGARKSDVVFPWSEDRENFAACNFALGHLRDNIVPRLSLPERGCQVEHLLASMGAIAGYATHLAAREENPSAYQTDLNVIGTQDGKTYYFAEIVNQALLGSSHSPFPHPTYSYWPVAAGGAVMIGMPVSDVPDIGAMFAHVASTVGGENAGRPSTEAQPVLSVDESMPIIWPLAEKCFSGRFPGADREFGEAPLKYWSSITAFAAQQVMEMSKGHVTPIDTLKITFESAIYASKLTPDVRAAWSDDAQQ